MLSLAQFEEAAPADPPYDLWLVTPAGFRRYGADLARQQNFARWVEYGLSSSIMIFLIAQITGITDIIALSTIFAVNAAMILFGWVQEKYEVPGEGGLLPFVFGSMVGVVPWLAVVFLLYARPDFMVDVSNLVWSCFGPAPGQ